MYTNRIEVTNPGGFYGRLTIDQLGNTQPDTRNPVLVTAMETLGKTENRYSGIPMIRFAMKNRNLSEPEFLDKHSEFSVILCNDSENAETESTVGESGVLDAKGLLEFCRTPRTRGVGYCLRPVCAAALP